MLLYSGGVILVFYKYQTHCLFHNAETDTVVLDIILDERQLEMPSQGCSAKL